MRRPLTSALRVAGLWLGLAAGAAVAQAAPPVAPLTTVAVDLTGLSEADWKQLDGLALEKRLVLRLVQDGFAVVASAAGPEVRLELTRTAAGLHLAAHSRVRDAEAQVPVGPEALAELHLELAQRSAALARACAPPPPVAPPPPPPPRPRAPVGATLGGALGFVTRQGGTDAAVRLVGRFGGRFGVEVMVGLVPSSVSAVTVLESPVTLGLGLRLELGHGFEVEGALAGGALVHVFLLSDPTAVDRVGVRVSAVGTLPLTLSYFPVPWFGIGLRVAPGVASALPTHSAGGLVVWARGPFWVEANGLAFLRF